MMLGGRTTIGVLVLLASVAPPVSAQVRVWQATLTLPTYDEGPPDPNPPFDQFATTRFNYPYTLRDQITAHSTVRNWRALYLENEYLKCSVLPDAGGHLYSCTDKLSGAEMFYANPSLKKANIGYRGAWCAFGIEFNFPVSHNWLSLSPVDFATRRNPDGSASIFVGATDRVYGMRWLVELVLRPASTVLEQHVTLRNTSDVRHRYYWWTNAGVQIWDDTHVYYPTRYTASHGFTAIDTWPVNRAGVDVSITGNHKAGSFSQFVHGSREPFMGLYHPRTRTGVVHYAEYGELPGKKLWTWGVTADGLEWRTALSDNRSAYAEVQAGLFRNQETYGYLDPLGEVHFTEYWMPVREIGGITRATPHGVVYLRREGGELIASLDVNHPISGARLRILDGARVLWETHSALEPARVFEHRLAEPPSAHCTFEVADSAGAILLSHTEDRFDWTPTADVTVGPQAAIRREGDALDLGDDQESHGELLRALDTYAAALTASPESLELNLAAGRLAVTLHRWDEAVRLLTRAQARRTSDAEIPYYLGIAYAALGDSRRARTEFEAAARQPPLRSGALLALARLTAREGDREAALQLLSGCAHEIEVPLLRTLGRAAQARERLAAWLARDPASLFLRHESVLLGAADDALWRHLAADPERVLNIASSYMSLGLWADALDLLARRYPAVDALEAEPGAVLPQDYPLIAYYRAYCRSQLGEDAAADLAEASRQSIRYVFPSRADSLRVLSFATRTNNPAAAPANFLLGSLYMSGGQTEAALLYWERARRFNPAIPTLHRNIARTLLRVQNDPQRALEVYSEGLNYDPENRELYTGLSVVQSILGRPAAERADALLRYPHQDALPAPMAFDLALSLAEAGRADAAERFFRGRFIAREEGAVNVRQVWVAVELLNAAKRPPLEARRTIDGLGKEVPGLAFTRDGMAPFLAGDSYHYQLGMIEARLGNADAARRHWSEAAALNGAFAVLAARQLNLPDWRTRAQSQLERANDVNRGYLLRALGRESEARDAFRRALLGPDAGLSHHLARIALLE
jgi:Flp pilus assembly protein TadD